VEVSIVARSEESKTYLNTLLGLKWDVSKEHSSFEEALEDDEIDLIDVTVPTYLHADFALRALQAGKHVLVETPACTTIEECRQIRAELSKHPKLKSATGHICRHWPTYKAAKALVDSGELGRIFYAESDYAHGIDPEIYPPRPHKREPHVTGRLSISYHSVHLLRYTVGDVEEVAGYVSDDASLAMLHFKNGTLGKVFSSGRVLRPYIMSLQVYGLNGTVICVQIQFFNTSDPSKILISTELAGFPITAFSGIEFMKEKYEADYRDRDSTLHIDKNEAKYRDLIPVTDLDERERLRNIRYCFVLGRLLGVLKPRVSGTGSEIVYEFTRDTHLRETSVELGTEGKVKVVLERNQQMLEELREEVMRRESRLLRQRGGKYNTEDFRNYYLTVYWYWETFYRTQTAQVSAGGRVSSSRNTDSRIFERKLDELSELYNQAWSDQDAAGDWDRFKREALSTLRHKYSSSFCVAESDPDVS
jgi:predicted dehydrogenase